MFCCFVFVFVLFGLVWFCFVVFCFFVLFCFLCFLFCFVLFWFVFSDRLTNANCLYPYCTQYCAQQLFVNIKPHCALFHKNVNFFKSAACISRILYVFVQESEVGEPNNLLFVVNLLRVRAFFHKTVRVCHIYCNFKIGFTCRITVIFGTLKDWSLLINTLASLIYLSYRNMFQNGVDALSKIVDAFLSKSSKFHLVRIIR